ncbi:enoyl-CoA hydratase-related protein [Paraburkholderia sp. D1E]|uniref:enoyl-CoA hydratase-related protein n=1 Tax=Paraburkholderia sp. D1E TaxID=3461398 RepID=UPI004045837E
MNHESVILEIDCDTAVLTLNRPQELNCLCVDLARDARDALAEVRENRAVRALVVTGAGRAFCAGAKLGGDDFSATAQQSIGQRVARDMAEYFNPLVVDLSTLPIPVIAAVNGVAAGAGVSLALAADVTIAARSSSFLLTFVPRLGILPDLGATWSLPRRVGRSRASGLALLGNKLTAQQAANWGLIWQCVDDASLMDEVRKLAHTVGHFPNRAIRELRTAFDVADSNDLVEQLEYERRCQEALLDTEDFREGVKAFMEKREPIFNGR